jgi:hypothetical protein
MTKLITVLCLGRSGTSNLIRMLECIKNIDVNDEIFNHNMCVTNSENTQLLEENKSIYFEKEKMYNKYLKYKNECHNLDILNFLLENCKKKYFLFKLFKWHLDKKQVDEIIERSDYVIILERKNKIDTYISGKKAIQLNLWKYNDTSDIKINFDIKDFSEHKQLHENTYNYYHEKCKNKKVLNLSYQQTFDKENFYKIISNFIHDLNINYETSEQLPIQDKERDYSKKISNYEEVKDFICRYFNNYEN